ncbi:MAG: methylated-DNA--[protein]-cysteine S-methyltransferase [Bacteroidota bacterium]
MFAKTYFDTPLGLVELEASDKGIRSLCFVDKPGEEHHPGHDHLVTCMDQLEEYFRGERMLFNLMLDLEGTAFQQRVWRQLQGIPFGETSSYLSIAKQIEAPNAMRAVGHACGRNKLWLLVPCHRVLSSDGKLTGYAGGLARKRWLIQHERGVRHGQQMTLFNRRWEG